MPKKITLCQAIPLSFLDATCSDQPSLMLLFGVFWSHCVRYLFALSSTSFSEDEKRSHFVQACAKIRGCTSLAEAVSNTCGFVSEAIVEQVDVKRAVISEIENYASPDCLIATNTLSIPLSVLHLGTKNPERILGLRFLHPVLFIPYVEFSMSERTTEDSKNESKNETKAASTGTRDFSAVDQTAESKTEDHDRRAEAVELNHSASFSRDRHFEECAIRVRDFMQSLGKTCFETSPLTEGTSLEQRLQARARDIGSDGRLRLSGIEAKRHQQREGRTRTSKDPEKLAMGTELGCVVCLDGPCEVLSVGCGHKVMCSACAVEMARKTFRVTCPLCRVEMHTSLTFVSQDKLQLPQKQAESREG